MSLLSELHIESLFTSIGIIPIIFCLLTLALLYHICMWNIFEKAKIDGWKALIPFYNFYLLCELAWRPGLFWSYLVIEFFVIPFFISYHDYTVFQTSESVSLFCVLLAMEGVFLCLIATILLNYKLCESFDKGIPFFFGMLLLNPVFFAILSFDSSKFTKRITSLYHENFDF